MERQRFNELINGPLAYRLVATRLHRLVLALHYVVQQCGEAGEKALEEICADYKREDEGEDENDDG